MAYRRNDCPEVAGGGLVSKQERAVWYSPPHRCWGQIQVGCLQECLKSELEMVALRLERLGETDTVGVSARTRGVGVGEAVVLSFHPSQPLQPWARVFIAKLDFQVNLAPGKRDALPFQRHC